jgi:hypothetical protein
MSDAALVILFQVLTLLGSVFTVVKLYRTGLYSRYRMFFLLFLFQIPNTIWPLFINYNSRSYQYFWTLTEPISWVLYVLVVLELYRLVLEKHRGLYSLGRWMMYVAIAVAVAISIASLLPRIKPTTPLYSRTLGYFFAVQRGLYFSLVLFILLILVFLSRYPVHLSRNVLVHAALYSIYFLFGTLGVLLRTIFGNSIRDQVNLFLTGMSSICVFAWFFLLTRKGEESQTNIPLFGPEQERRALEQLEALNATLLKVSRN